MITLQIAENIDWEQWKIFDTHLTQELFHKKTLLQQAFFITKDNEPIGVLRYNLFWDEIPFLNLILIHQDHHNNGYGKKAMDLWEALMKKQHYEATMLSTQVDEDAQHFYRKLGYIDKGSLFLDHTPYEQAQELIMIKTL